MFNHRLKCFARIHQQMNRKKKYAIKIQRKCHSFASNLTNIKYARWCTIGMYVQTLNYIIHNEISKLSSEQNRRRDMKRCKYIFKHKRKMVIIVHKFNYTTTIQIAPSYTKNRVSWKKMYQTVHIFLLKYSRSFSFLTPSSYVPSYKFRFSGLIPCYFAAITGIWSCRDKRGLF